MFIPIDSVLSILYLSKPSINRFSDIKQTCALSIAWTCIPESVHSKVAFVKRSFTASIIFFKIKLCVKRASNILIFLINYIIDTVNINNKFNLRWRTRNKELWPNQTRRVRSCGLRMIPNESTSVYRPISLFDSAARAFIGFAAGCRCHYNILGLFFFYTNLRR